jgi:hypothetical protein
MKGSSRGNADYPRRPLVVSTFEGYIVVGMMALAVDLLAVANRISDDDGNPRAMAVISAVASVS